MIPYSFTVHALSLNRQTESKKQAAGSKLPLFQSLRYRKGKVLFVCLGNSCRSQMAEAFARIHGGDVLEAHSAGIAPAARVSRVTRQVMGERSIDLDGQRPKAMDQYDLNSFDLIVNLSDYALPKSQAHVVPCPVRDPMGRGEDFHREVRDRIEWIVKNLITQFREADRRAAAPWGLPA
jgi:arsenate reductase